MQAAKENQARGAQFKKENQLLATRQASEYLAQDKQSLRVLKE
jgi:hypothetical protein